MTRLERYLEKNAVSVEEACTTNSKYYRIGAAIIRYSDHISTDYSSFDVQIIKPTGSFSRLYTFGVTNSSRISHMNTSQIIAYLPYAAMHAELMGRTVIREINRNTKPGEIVESRLLRNTQFEKIVYRLKKVFKDYMDAAQKYIDAATDDLNLIVEQRNKAIQNANKIIEEYKPKQ